MKDVLASFERVRYFLGQLKVWCFCTSRLGIGNEQGNMLVAALIGIAITGVMFVILITMIDTSQKATRALSQKLEIVQLQNFLAGVLANSDLCSCNFDSTKNKTQAQSSLAFNSTGAVTLASSKIDLTNLYGRCVAGAPADPILTKNTLLSGTTSGLLVSSMFLEDFKDAGAPGSGRYTAQFTVAFDTDRLEIARHPLTVRMNIDADITNPTQTRILSCSTGDATAIQNEINRQLSSRGSCPTNEYLSGFNPDGTLNCMALASGATPTPTTSPAPTGSGKWTVVSPCVDGRGQPPFGACSPLGAVRSGTCTMSYVTTNPTVVGVWMAQCM